MSGRLAIARLARIVLFKILKGGEDMSGDKKSMTAEEVHAFIDASINWSDKEKQGVRRLYSIYISMMGMKEGTHGYNLHLKYKEQLRQLGIEL
jgi:hypothetical protein